jgi:uroporphyrinogen decarboxylase
VQEGKALKAHIFNLGHGILPDTPLENVERLVETVKGAPHA